MLDCPFCQGPSLLAKPYPDLGSTGIIFRNLLFFPFKVPSKLFPPLSKLIVFSSGIPFVPGRAAARIG